tara:strand:- start:2254 stop:2778 length:525 start_codon:yes stop_codon:yes gene_type:complete
MAKLTVQVPDAEEAVYEFDEPQITVGRSEGNHIIIDHGSLSGVHSQLVQNADGTYTISDNQSTNGTFVNGQQIHEALLEHGSEILFGQISARFEQPEAMGYAAVEAPVSAGDAVGSFASTPLDSTGRPANFHSISPFPKNIKKKDAVGSAVKAFGFVAIVCAVGVVAATFVFLK